MFLVILDTVYAGTVVDEPELLRSSHGAILFVPKPRLITSGDWAFAVWTPDFGMTCLRIQFQDQQNLCHRLNHL